MAVRAIPATFRRAYRTAIRGRSAARSVAVASRAAHGRPRGRSDDRTGWHPAGCGAGTRHQEGITSPGTACHLAVPLGTLTSQNSPMRYAPSGGNRVHTEEVTGS